MNNLKTIFLELYQFVGNVISDGLESEQRYIFIGLFFIIALLALTISVWIIKTVNISDTVKEVSSVVKDGYRKLDRKANTSLMNKLLMASGDSDYNIKLGLLDRLDLKLIARSNIRSRIFFLNIYVFLIIQIGIFIFALPFMYSLFMTWKTAIVVSLFIALIPMLLLQSLTTLNNKKTRHTIANFLTLILGQLEIRNDLVHALEQVVDDIDDPLRSYLYDSIAQLKNNIDPDKVFDILSYKLNNPQFFIIAKNFKSVFKNGGDIVALVKVLEAEAYMIDNEFETRVVDTFTTRMLVHLMLLVAFFFLIGLMFINPMFHRIYTETDGGKNILFFSTIIFILGIIFNMFSSTSES